MDKKLAVLDKEKITTLLEANVDQNYTVIELLTEIKEGNANFRENWTHKNKVTKRWALFSTGLSIIGLCLMSVAALNYPEETKQIFWYYFDKAQSYIAGE